MIVHKLQPVTDIFDWLHVAWENCATQRRVALAILWVYLCAMLGIELNRQGLLPPRLGMLVPDNHFYAIHLAFTLILGLEVMSLIFIIPRSLSQSIGKQFELLTLILLRNAFKELSNLPEPVSVMESMQSVLHIGISGLGALSVYLCLGLYRRMARRNIHFIHTPELRMRYVLSKKLLALALFGIFAVTAIRDLTLFVRTGADQHFFETLYTVLIFADIAMVLIAQLYMPAFHAVFRNSGFVIATLLMRLALSASPLWNPAIGLFAALFMLALTWCTNRFMPAPQFRKTHKKSRKRKILSDRPQPSPSKKGKRPHSGRKNARQEHSQR